MRKIVAAVLCLLLCVSTTVNAFEITEIKPDDSFLIGLGTNINVDKAYLKSIVEQYGSRYVVTERSYADITDIDSFFTEMSAPLTLDEFDDGKTEFRSGVIQDESMKKMYTTFKVLGGHGGYSVEFEPVAYYNIYRNITLVGGYVQYYKTHADPYEAYWQYICNVEKLTKEIVPYDTRMKLVERFGKLSDFMDNDRTFKIFILKDGHIESLFKRGDGL